MGICIGIKGNSLIVTQLCIYYKDQSVGMYQRCPKMVKHISEKAKLSKKKTLVSSADVCSYWNLPYTVKLERRM